jgi:hypothetical protein
MQKWPLQYRKSPAWRRSCGDERAGRAHAQGLVRGLPEAGWCDDVGLTGSHHSPDAYRQREPLVSSERMRGRRGLKPGRALSAKISIQGINLIIFFLLVGALVSNGASVAISRLQPLSDLTGDFRYGGFDVLPSDGIRIWVFGTPAW